MGKRELHGLGVEWVNQIGLSRSYVRQAVSDAALPILAASGILKIRAFANYSMSCARQLKFRSPPRRTVHASYA